MNLKRRDTNEKSVWVTWTVRITLIFNVKSHPHFALPIYICVDPSSVGKTVSQDNTKRSPKRLG